MRISKESYLDCEDAPAPPSESQEAAEMESGEGQSSEIFLWEPQHSDCLPSVFLAISLALVFILVSWLLLPCDKGSHVLLHDCQAMRSNESCTTVPCIGSLRLLFPNQPESTWQVLQQHVSHEPFGRQTDGAWILAAVGRGDVRNTLLCFLKAILLLVTEEHTVGIRFVEQNSAWLPRMGVRGNGTSAVTTTEIYVGPSRIPHGVMVSLRSSMPGNQLGSRISLAWILNMTDQARKEFLLHSLTPVTVFGFLSRVCFANRVPNELKTTQGSIPVLLVRPEWYLEEGRFC